MTDQLAPLIVDLLVWLDREPRSYAEVMDAWRTSCPRLTVWEDAIDQGLARREARGGTTWIVPTAEGRQFLTTRRATTAAAA
ncbi:hypothetical protein [Phreatobacter sp. AB_2022a]|uniref:hypothetical protein n=1 Tax=Phreatobacter sp. AB_2022a TaxID=3003134 RepID=UPI002287342E|nr:hypothetical protein [Phreatobacter sp. AB_2022a]MCZ0737121.1 hypothetical protein [Phreatobacter sp. AB_2022a]